MKNILRQKIYNFIFSIRFLIQEMNLKLKIYGMRWRLFCHKAHICWPCLTGTAHIILISLLLFWPAVAFGHPISMDAIAEIESSNNPNAVGASGEIGLYQISPIVLKHFNQVFQGKPKQSPYDIKYKVDDPKHLTYSGEIDWKYTGDFKPEDLKHPIYNREVADWYFNWLFDRCWTVKDTLIAWNWGIGNWRRWREIQFVSFLTNNDQDKYLPKTTQVYLKRYEEITGDKL